MPAEIRQASYYASSDPRSPISLKKKCWETIHPQSNFSPRQQNNLSKAIQSTNNSNTGTITASCLMSHCLSRRMGCFEESLLFQKARHLRISRRLGAINLMVFDLHKTIPTHRDLLRASKWSFWCLLLLSFSFSFLPFHFLFWSFFKKRNFRFAAKSRGGYRDCPLHLHSLSHYQPFPLGGTFVPTDIDTS